MPAESRTTPDTVPEEGFGEVCAVAGRAPQLTPIAEANNTPKHRRGPCFTSVYLPGVAFAAVLGSKGFLIEKSADREMLFCDTASVALTSRVYLPAPGLLEEQAFDGDLIASLLHFLRRLLELHDLLVALLHGVHKSGIGLVGLLVGFRLYT